MQDFQFGGPSGSNGGSGGSSSNGNGKVPPLIREFLSSLDDKEWQSELYKLLQNQSFNQVEVDLFELLCKVLDHNLFAQVDWARNSYYFKELKVGSKTFSVDSREHGCDYIPPPQVWQRGQLEGCLGEGGLQNAGARQDRVAGICIFPCPGNTNSTASLSLGKVVDYLAMYLRGASQMV